MKRTRALQALIEMIEALWQRELERGLLLLGPAGIGKSTLLDQLRAHYGRELPVRLARASERTDAREPESLPYGSFEPDGSDERRLILLDGFQAPASLRAFAKAWRPGDALVVTAESEEVLQWMPNFFTPFLAPGVTDEDCVRWLTELDLEPPHASVVAATAQVLLERVGRHPADVLAALERARRGEALVGSPA